jgi:hypothetical protein
MTLKLARCSVCGIFVDYSPGDYSQSLKQALKKRKSYVVLRKSDRALLFSKRRKGDRRRTLVCSNCLADFWGDSKLAQIRHK